MLDRSPDELISENESAAGKADATALLQQGSSIAVQDHPTYSKYFKMLKIGTPKQAVVIKMKQDGVDPSFLDKAPTDQVPLGHGPATVSVAAPKPKAPAARKKKLHWKPIDTSKISKNSLWADDDEGDGNIELDQREFDKFFVAA